MRRIIIAAAALAALTVPAVAQAHPLTPGYPAASLPAAHAYPHNQHRHPALWGTRNQHDAYRSYMRRIGWTPVRYGRMAERSHNPAVWLWTYRLWTHREHWAHKMYAHHQAAIRRQADADPVALGRVLAADRGWTGYQWDDLYALWNRESGWNPLALNSSSGACGIPQALPCSKIPDHSARGQIEWGLGYIAADYGSPAAAWAHSEAYGWY